MYGVLLSEVRILISKYQDTSHLHLQLLHLFDSLHKTSQSRDKGKYYISSVIEIGAYTIRPSAPNPPVQTSTSAPPEKPVELVWPRKDPEVQHRRGTLYSQVMHSESEKRRKLNLTKTT